MCQRNELKYTRARTHLSDINLLVNRESESGVTRALFRINDNLLW